jgi:uncharacterized protein YbaR (Trm112 family)
MEFICPICKQKFDSDIEHLEATICPHCWVELYRYEQTMQKQEYYFCQ